MTLKLIGLVLLAAGIMIFESIRHVRKGTRKEAWVSSLIIFGSLILYILILAHRTPTSLVQPYRYFFEKLGKMILKK